MRIAAMAAGAVGSYFGGRLQAAGHDVAYIARRANLEALKKDGLKIQSVHGDLHLPKVFATPDPKEVAFAKRVLEAMPDGTGAVMIDGRMQDDATWKQCKVVVDLAKQGFYIQVQVLGAETEGSLDQRAGG